MGFDIPALNRALGIQREAPVELSAQELLAKYRALYEGAKRAVLQIPDEKLDWVTPQEERRGQTLRQLAFHLFDRPAVCMDAAEGGQYTYETIHEYLQLANNYRTTREIVNYAEVTMSRLAAFLTSRADLLDKVVATYFGPATVRQLLNQALAGLALRLKQTYHFQSALGIKPERPLGDEDFAGIFVPKKIFG